MVSTQSEYACNEESISKSDQHVKTEKLVIVFV